jgi:hypothetical protein
MSSLGLKSITTKPFFYHNAILWEKYRLTYFRGGKVMENIHISITFFILSGELPRLQVDGILLLRPVSGQGSKAQDERDCNQRTCSQIGCIAFYKVCIIYKNYIFLSQIFYYFYCKIKHLFIKLARQKFLLTNYNFCSSRKKYKFYKRR